MNDLIWRKNVLNIYIVYPIAQVIIWSVVDMRDLLAWDGAARFIIFHTEIHRSMYWLAEAELS